MKFILFALLLLSLTISTAFTAHAQAEKQRTHEDSLKEKYSYKPAVLTKAIKEKKKRAHNNVHNDFTLLNISYGTAMGGVNAPFKSSLVADFSWHATIIHDHVSLGCSLNGGYRFAPNINWFARVYGIQPEQVTGIKSGYSGALSFVAMAVLVNKHRFALTLGPDCGLGLYYTPENTRVYGGAIFDDKAAFGFTYGLRTYAFVGKKLSFSIAYSGFSRKEVSVSTAGIVQSTSVYTPVDHSMLLIGIGIRADDWWW